MLSNREKTAKQSKELAGKIIKAVLMFLVILMCIYASIWSYFQTEMFLRSFNDPTCTPESLNVNCWVSNALAIIIQYGQSALAIWIAFDLAKAAYYSRQLRQIEQTRGYDYDRPSRTADILKEQRRKALGSALAAFVLFLVFTGIDGGTNQGSYFAQGKTMNTMQKAVGVFICWSVVFIEEIAIKVTDIFLHTINDIRTALRLPRWRSFDLWDPETFGNVEEEKFSNVREAFTQSTSTRYQEPRPLHASRPPVAIPYPQAMPSRSTAPSRPVRNNPTYVPLKPTYVQEPTYRHLGPEEDI